MKNLKITIGSITGVWALFALLAIPKCVYHLDDPIHGPFMTAMLIAAASSGAAGSILSIISFKSALRKTATHTCY